MAFLRSARAKVLLRKLDLDEETFVALQLDRHVDRGPCRLIGRRLRPRRGVENLKEMTSVRDPRGRIRRPDQISVRRFGPVKSLTASLNVGTMTTWNAVSSALVN